MDTSTSMNTASKPAAPAASPLWRPSTCVNGYRWTETGSTFSRGSACGSPTASSWPSSAPRARASRRLLGIIAGLDSPSSGQVLVDGTDITRMSEGKLASVRNQKIGMVFQAFNLIPTLTAQENVEVPLYVGKHPGRPSDRAVEILNLVGLGHRLAQQAESALRRRTAARGGGSSAGHQSGHRDHG